MYIQQRNSYIMHAVTYIYTTTKDKYMDDDALTSVYIDKIMLT